MADAGLGRGGGETRMEWNSIAAAVAREENDGGADLG